ncbi:phage minor capsid protein [Bacillus paranthracis]|uniref:phage minor capsid protein n=1 Tax=Bacillus paranthracis TaxID=2026186 RepID=UPI003D65F626
MQPQRQQQLTDNTVQVYNAIEEEILMNMANYLKKNKGLLNEQDIHAWQIRQLSMLGALTQDNVITIAKYSGLAVDEVSTALKVAQYEAIAPVNTVLTKAVQLGLLVKPLNYYGLTLEGIFNKYLLQAKNTFNMVNTVLLDSARQAYLDVVNTVVGKVVAGAKTPRQALREGLQKWATKGLPALVDKVNRRWSPDAYIRMVTRSTVNNVANVSQFQRMDENGCDLIETTSKMGAREKCAPYQGRIFSRSGTHPNYPAWSTTSYGLPDGILGINCGHVIHPYIEGLNTQRYFPQDPHENQKAYEQSQVQRANERAIRKAKTELAMMEALGDKDGIKKAQSKVKNAQATMREFIKNTGRTRRYEREQPASQILKDKVK